MGISLHFFSLLTCSNNQINFFHLFCCFLRFGPQTSYFKVNLLLFLSEKTTLIFVGDHHLFHWLLILLFCVYGRESCLWHRNWGTCFVWSYAGCNSCVNIQHHILSPEYNQGSPPSTNLEIVLSATRINKCKQKTQQWVLKTLNNSLNFLVLIWFQLLTNNF